MKRYQSHKVVEAAKIVGIRTPTRGGVELVLSGDETVMVNGDWLQRWVRTPGVPTGVVGGYFVRYADGYESWSPAEAFESGYTEVSDE